MTKCIADKQQCNGTLMRSLLDKLVAAVEQHVHSVPSLNTTARQLETLYGDAKLQCNTSIGVQDLRS